MKRIGDHPNRGRKPYPTLAEIEATPQMSRRLREIHREFANQNKA